MTSHKNPTDFSRGSVNKIKFSHNYPKIFNQRQAKLIHVNLINRDGRKIHEDLLFYDTRWLDKYGNWQKYILPETGDLIQLIFLGDKLIPFCTLRRYTREKFVYYNNLINKDFEVIINESEQIKES